MMILTWYQQKIFYIEADKVVKIYEPKISSLSYEETYKNTIFNNSDFDTTKEKLLFNKLHSFKTTIKYATNLKKTDYFSLPYISQIEEHTDNFEYRIKYRIHEEKKLLREFNRLLYYLYKIEREDVIIKETEPQIVEKKNAEIYIETKENKKFNFAVFN